MRTAIVICSRNGVVIATYNYPFPETQDDGRVVLPERADLIVQAQADLQSSGLATPATWGDIGFEIEYK